MVPGFKSPEGESALAPTSCTVSEVMEVTGATPGWSASRSVKLLPLSGTAVICAPVMTSPICVLVVSTWSWFSTTVTTSDRSPTWSAASMVKALFASMTIPVRR